MKDERSGSAEDEMADKSGENFGSSMSQNWNTPNKDAILKHIETFAKDENKHDKT